MQTNQTRPGTKRLILDYHRLEPVGRIFAAAPGYKYRCQLVASSSNNTIAKLKLASIVIREVKSGKNSHLLVHGNNPKRLDKLRGRPTPRLAGRRHHLNSAHGTDSD